MSFDTTDRFGRRTAIDGAAPAYSTTQAVSTAPTGRTADSIACRLWAVVAVLGAGAALAQGWWIAAALIAMHAVLVWPECIRYAADQGVGRPRALLAWLTLPAAGIASMVASAAGATAEAPAAALMQAPAPAQSITLGQLRAKVPEHAVLDIDRSFYPKLYAKLGAASVARANGLNTWVALYAASSPSCDRVDIVEVADAATRGKLVWFADCLNHERFYVTEAQALGAKAQFNGQPDTLAVNLHLASLPLSESGKLAAFDQTAAVAQCESTVKSILQAGGSYRASGAWRTTQHPMRGRVTIVRGFTAKNAFNARLDSQWDCLVDAADNSIIELKYLDGGEWRALTR